MSSFLRLFIICPKSNYTKINVTNVKNIFILHQNLSNKLLQFFFKMEKINYGLLIILLDLKRSGPKTWKDRTNAIPSHPTMTWIARPKRVIIT